jgi:hypothetical protein
MSEIKKLISEINRNVLSDRIDRKVLSAVHSQTAIRIFSEGKNANGASLGVYSKGYQRLRDKKGMSTKVNLQFTGQMLKDYALRVEGVNEYGSGFANSTNFDKSEWVEATYNVPIFELTKDEEKLLEQLYEKELSGSLD